MGAKWITRPRIERRAAGVGAVADRRTARKALDSGEVN